MLSYQIRERGKRALAGVTQPVHGKIAAVLKSDGAEVPTCVYNELVATRLGALIGLPAATGVLAQGRGGQEYASLLAATPGGRLPPISAHRARWAVLRYPEPCAAVLVFDVFIGNWDRGGNIKAALATPVDFFCAFDHSHALLALGETPEASIKSLSQPDPAIANHVFNGLVDPDLAHRWAMRVAALADEAIEMACCPGAEVNTVGKTLQRQLAQALITRKARLPGLVARFLKGSA